MPMMPKYAVCVMSVCADLQKKNRLESGSWYQSGAGVSFRHVLVSLLLKCWCFSSRGAGCVPIATLAGTRFPGSLKRLPRL